MRYFMKRFAAEDAGQGLAEYSLIIVFAMFVIMGFAGFFHGSISGVAGITNTHLTAAAVAASQ